MAVQEWNLVYIPFSEEEDDPYSEITSICDPLKKDYKEIPREVSVLEADNQGPDLSLDNVEDILSRKDETLSEKEFTDYRDEYGLAAREYFLHDGRLFFSRNGLVENLADDAGLEYETLSQENT